MALASRLTVPSTLSPVQGPTRASGTPMCPLTRGAPSDPARVPSNTTCSAPTVFTREGRGRPDALQLRQRGVHALGVQRDGASDVGAREVAGVGQHDAFDRRAREAVERLTIVHLPAAVAAVRHQGRGGAGLRCRRRWRWRRACPRSRSPSADAPATPARPNRRAARGAHCSTVSASSPVMTVPSTFLQRALSAPRPVRLNASRPLPWSVPCRDVSDSAFEREPVGRHQPRPRRARHVCSDRPVEIRTLRRRWWPRAAAAARRAGLAA